MCISASTNTPCAFLEQRSVSCLSILSYSSVFSYILPVFKTFLLLFICLPSILGDTERLWIQVEGMLRGHRRSCIKKKSISNKRKTEKKSHIPIASLHKTTDKTKIKRCLNYKNHTIVRERGSLKQVQGGNWFTGKWVLKSQC